MLAEAAVDLAFELRWPPETVLDLTIPQIAAYQRAHQRRLELRLAAQEQARKATARGVAGVRTSLEAYTARQQAEEDDDE
jgi:hypothetical protein